MEKDDIKQNRKVIKQINNLQNKKFTNEEKEKMIKKIEASYLPKINGTNVKKEKDRLNSLLTNRKEKILSFKKHPTRETKIKSLKKKLNKRMKVKKIRLYLNQSQKKTLLQWMGTTRYLYNKLLAKIEAKEEKAIFQNLRNDYIPKSKIPDEEKWMLNVPKDVRAEAIRDLCKAYSTTFQHLKKGLIKRFKMHFRKKRSNSQSFVIPRSAINFTSNNGIQIYKSILNENSIMKINKREKLPELQFDCRIKMFRPKVWYMFIPYSTSKKRVIENQDTQIVALDPGVRTFLTGYSPNGHAIEIGKNDINRISRLCLYIDKLQSAIDSKQLKCKTKIKICKKMDKLRRKVRNLKDDLHYKTCKYLCDNYNVILLPNFEVSKLVCRATRQIRSKSVRRLLSLNHSEFRQRLLEKSLDYENTDVFICNEAYTSKTCSNCGFENCELGDKKVYKCPICNLSIDRDMNGARNILLRALVAIPIQDK